MKIVIKKDKIIVGRLFLSKDEFKFICGALNSVIKCKEKEITLLEGSFIIKIDRYEVHIDYFSEYEFMYRWKEYLHILETILPFKCSLPLFPINRIIEVKGQTKTFLKHRCDCGYEAERFHFEAEKCPLCKEREGGEEDENI
jgi:hypothetical protein